MINVFKISPPFFCRIKLYFNLVPRRPLRLLCHLVLTVAFAVALFPRPQPPKNRMYKTRLLQSGHVLLIGAEIVLFIFSRREQNPINPLCVGDCGVSRVLFIHCRLFFKHTIAS